MVICITVSLGHIRYQTFQLQLLLQILVAFGCAFFFYREDVFDKVTFTCMISLLILLLSFVSYSYNNYNIILVMWYNYNLYHGYLLWIMFIMHAGYQYTFKIWYIALKAMHPTVHNKFQVVYWSALAFSRIIY